MSRRRKSKSLNNIIEDYFISSRIYDYYKLPAESHDKIFEEDGDYFAVKLEATLTFWKDREIVRGIQKRIMLALRNSFTEKCFAGYDLKDTSVSINQISPEYSSRLFSLKSLEAHIDNTACSHVKLFSGTMQNGYSQLAARLEEKEAVVYLHKSQIYLSAFEMLAPFVKEESDREWLVYYMQRFLEEKPELHF
ncbi:MAG: hypothetical protein PHO02_05835 [Candidatus Nanoarchaeia archaeon]|nr:hypothetical protein [Candidatus Nanoarchaeia archaeon]